MVIKMVEENTEVNLHNLGLGNDFLNTTAKAQAIEEKVVNLDFIKIKNCFALRDTIRKMKRQPTDWEKIFANHIFEHISRLYPNYIYHIFEHISRLSQLHNKMTVQFLNGQRIRIYQQAYEDAQHH